MTEVINMVGARGGAGVTTCAVLLGAALAKAGERTLIADGDFKCAAVLEICGLRGLSVYTLADVEEGACRVKQAIIRHPKIANLYILPTLGSKSAKSAEDAVSECGQLFDKVLCDNAAPAACNRAIVISDGYTHSVPHARLKCAELRDRGFKQVEVLVNKVNGGLVFDSLTPTPQEFATLAGAPLFGVVPEDLCLPLGRIKPATQKAFSILADKLCGKEQQPFKIIKPYIGLKGSIKRRLRYIV